MFFHNWHWKLATQLVIWGIIHSCTNSAFAQEVVPDNTLPNNSVVNLENNIRTITGGTRAGSNLFHSFERFGVPTGSEVNFDNALDINNIINRVTGSSISNIDGLIRANGSANLFLINPNGIVFGENARLDIGGSFIGSTADAIWFGENNFFSATNPENTPLLRVNVPLGLQYGANPGNISVTGTGAPERGAPELFGVTSGLQVPFSKTLALIGGNVSLEGAILKTEGGRIELGSVAQSGIVNIEPVEKGFSFGFGELENFGEIQLSQITAVDATGNGSGDVRFSGKNLTITDSSVISSTQTGTEKSAGIVVNTTESVDINGINDTFISSGFYANNVSKNATEEAGNITINTQQLTVGDRATVTTNVWETGDGGDININANNLRIEGGAKVSAATFNIGNGGDLNIIDAENVEVVGTSDDDGGSVPTQLSANAEKGSTGKGGNLNITTNNLLVSGGAFISGNTFGEGDGGDITINPISDNATSKVEVAGSGGNNPGNNRPYNSGIFVVGEPPSTGNAGNLTINTKQMLVQGKAFVSASANSKGNGGNLTINATDSLRVLGDRTFVIAGTSNEGEAGDLKITTDTLLIENGPEVGTGTGKTGNGGNVIINAKNVQVIGVGNDTGKLNPSELTVQAGEGSTGNAGNLTINAQSLKIQDGAQVGGDTFGAGRGGVVTVNVPDIEIIGTGGKEGETPSSLSSSAKKESTGNAGDLNIITNRMIVRDGAFVAANTSSDGDGGDLNINASDVQIIGRGGQNPGNNNRPYVSGIFVTAEPKSPEVPSTGNAGKFTINTATMLVQDGAIVSASTNSNGNGGDLTINATDSLRVLDRGSDIISGTSSQSSEGKAGDIKITTNSLLIENGGEISSGTSGRGDGGNLTVDAKIVQLAGMGDSGPSFNEISVRTNKNSTGNAGNLTINTDILKIENGSQVDADTFGAGKGGNVTVNATDIEIIGTGNNGNTPSSLSASAKEESTGDAGEVNITTQRMLVVDGAFVATSTEGTGNGGNLTINAQDLKIIGVGGENPENDNLPYFSGLFTSADSKSTGGNAGDLTINTTDILVEGGALVAAGTFSSGDGGNLTVNASDVQLIGMGNNSQFDTALFARVTEGATGNGGNLFVNTNTLSIKDEAKISVESLGFGNAGIITLNARSIDLENNALVSASTQNASTQIVDSNNEQATINIDARDLILRRGSNIFTNAEGENVQGGNINIDSSVIVALENSDISANSAEGRGGNINIEAQGIFGTQFREETSDESDITATGANSELSGSVEINGLEQNPAEVLTELPDSPLEREFYNACQVGAGENASEFYIVGKGGIPPSPLDLLQEESVDVGWVSLPSGVEGGDGEVGRVSIQNPSWKVWGEENLHPQLSAKSVLESFGSRESTPQRQFLQRREPPQQTGSTLSKIQNRIIQNPKSKIPNRIVEATGWVVDENGDIFFVAQASPQNTPSFNNKSCVKK